VAFLTVHLSVMPAQHVCREADHGGSEDEKSGYENEKKSDY